MPGYLKILLACLLLGVGVGCYLSWGGPGKPPLSRKQEKATRTAVARSWQIAVTDTARAARADSAARRAYTRGQAVARMARQYHRLTSPAHASLPASPSAATADSLQRLLAAYGR